MDQPPPYDMERKVSASSSTQSQKSQPNCLQKAGSFLSGGLERFYYMLGVNIARRPAVTIACVLAAYGLCSVGLMNFYEIDPSDPIWVDPKSDYMTDKTWVDQEFPSELRTSILIIESDNILKPAALLELYDIHEELTNITGAGYNYTSICYQLGRGDDAPCWTTSILELWEFNRTVIAALTDQDVIDTINNTADSPVFGTAFNASLILGGIENDTNGVIVSAKAAMITYFMKRANSTDKDVTEDEVTGYVEKWEQELIWLARNFSGESSNLKAISVFATRSFGDEIGSSIFGDIGKLSGGYILIIFYMALVLGRFNCMEQRVWLALAAVLGVGLSLALSFGLSSAFGIGYGPVQSILPFLLLGLGVDDAFVIVQAWNRLTLEERKLPLTTQAGLALKHAGVSITVTSVTDFAAFGIGATTVLPALRDFCIYAAIGIVGLLIVQSTFFMACVIIDEKRKKANRNACCCCYTHKEDYETNNCSKRDIQQHFFENMYGPTLTKLPVKIVVMVVSLAFLAVGIAGAVFLKQEYDRNIFIPSDSYLQDYLAAYEEYFPDQGVDSGHIYLKDTDYYVEHDKIDELASAFQLDPSVEEGSVDLWLTGFKEWLADTKCTWIKSHVNETTGWPLDERRFHMLLTPFVYSTIDGRRHIRNINFNATLEDINSDETPENFTNLVTLPLDDPDVLEIEATYAKRRVTSSRISFTFVDIPTSADGIRAMDDTRKVVESHYPRDKAFAYSISFETWETDKIIQQELYRNLGIAFGCVVILTLFLIADIGNCLLVSICVMATLVEVGGFMHWWGLTVDTVTCIQLVLAIGLAVDYSAHIGHTFMTVTGDRNERTRKTLADIGPAVFNGGFSTLLAFLLLASSSSYVFDVFFRVNLLVVLLGMWNGIVLLPVLLSWVGPAPYLTASSHTTSKVDESHKSLNHHPTGQDNAALSPEILPDSEYMKGKQESEHHANGHPVHVNGSITSNSSKAGPWTVSPSATRTVSTANMVDGSQSRLPDIA